MQNLSSFPSELLFGQYTRWAENVVTFLYLPCEYILYLTTKRFQTKQRSKKIKKLHTIQKIAQAILDVYFKM